MKLQCNGTIVNGVCTKCFHASHSTSRTCSIHVEVEVEQKIMKQQQKQLLIDIMEADAKDGLYEPAQTPVEWLFVKLYETMQMKGDGRVMDALLEKAKQMEKERSKRVALHFMTLGIKNKGDYSKVDFYKEIEKL